MAPEPASEDTEVFLKLATFVGRRANWTVADLAGYVASRLEPRQKSRIVDLLELTTQRRRDAETAAIALAKSTWLPQRDHRSVRVSDSVRRSTDWSRTTVARASSSGLTYVSVDRQPRPDVEAIGALGSVLTQWSMLLRSIAELGDDFDTRSTRLENVRVELERRTPVRRVPWTDAIAKRWAAVSPAEVARLVAGLSLTRRALSEADGKLLANLLGTERAPNEDGLLEVSAALGIVAAAVGTDPPWAVSFNGPLEKLGKEPDIHLSSQGIVCRIRKGRPRPPLGADAGLRGNYRLKLAEQARLPEEGGQPDLVLTFWRAGNERHFVTVIADAKRNTTGHQYLSVGLSRMLAYCVEYADWLGFSVGPSQPPSATIQPVATLFGWDPIRTRSGAAASRVVGAAGKLVDVFDRDDLRDVSSGGASAIGEWFTTLASQARVRLADLTKSGRRG